MQLKILITLFWAVIFCSSAFSQQVKFISGCEIDLNGDTQNDLAVNMEKSDGAFVLVFLKQGDKYAPSYEIKNTNNVSLECKYGKSLVDKDKNMHVIKAGAYLLLEQLESSSSALIYSEREKIEEIWLSK